MEKWVDPKSGQPTRRIKHLGSLLRVVQPLVNQSQVNVIVVVSCFPNDDVDDYRQEMA